MKAEMALRPFIPGHLDKVTSSWSTGTVVALGRSWGTSELWPRCQASSLRRGQNVKRVRPPGSAPSTTVAERGSTR
jgi:hypothetical protein